MDEAAAENELLATLIEQYGQEEVWFASESALGYPPTWLGYTEGGQAAKVDMQGLVLVSQSLGS